MYQVQVTARESYTADRSAQWCSMSSKLCGTREAMLSLRYGTPALADDVCWWSRWRFFPAEPAGLHATRPRYGFSGVYVPGK